MEKIYENVLSAERWLSFGVPGYRGLESGDPNWPDEGSSIVVRFGLGPWSTPFKVTVLEHERGHRFLTHEEAFSGLYIDDAGFTFQQEGGTIKITLIRNQTSKSILIRILLLLIYPVRWVTARRVKGKIRALVEI